jgi:hypothetical protein
MVDAETQTDDYFQSFKKKQDHIKRLIKDSRKKLDEQIN